MKAHEARAAGQVAGSALGRLTGVVRGVHRAISDLVHDGVGMLVGPAAVPVKLAHDTVSAGVYAVTGLGLDAGARLAGAYAAHRLTPHDDSRPSVHDGRSAHHAIAFGSGIFGDEVWHGASALMPSMQVRHAGHPVELTREGVSAAYGQVSAELAVFVHGLVETEAAWRLRATSRAPYADRLRSDLGLTPVMIRYNTGLRISENGRLLADLLSDLVAAWPVAPQRIVLIGHSMGGLVIHGALAQDPAPGWLTLVSDTVTLGSPHHGSPLARSVFDAAERLAAGERTRFAADFLRLRSAGVRDLAHGNIVAADWDGHDPDDRTDRRTHPGGPEGIRHHAVAAIASRRLPARVSAAVGDVLVPHHSAVHAESTAVTSRYGDETIGVVHGVSHIGLLNDEETYGHLHRWLS